MLIPRAILNSAALIRRFDAAEESVCITFNRWSHRAAIRVFFSIVSRLGNGVFWYVLVLGLPILFGAEATIRTLQISVTGIAGHFIYKWLKQRFVRERPYISHLTIRAGTAPLDRYSFPSGHTLHAVSLTILLVTYFPMLAWLVIPFAFLVAISRVVLGLHYPTDVAVGALIGTMLALASINMAGMTLFL